MPEPRGDRVSGRRAGPVIATFGHVGDGTSTSNIILDRDDPEGEAKLHRATDALYRAAIALGGTVTAEHGIGLARRDYLELQRGAGAVAMMRRSATALDLAGHPQPGQGAARGLSPRRVPVTARAVSEALRPRRASHAPTDEGAGPMRAVCANGGKSRPDARGVRQQMKEQALDAVFRRNSSRRERGSG